MGKKSGKVIEFGHDIKNLQEIYQKFVHMDRIFGYTFLVTTTVLFQKMFFFSFFCLKQRKNKEKTNKQLILYIYLTNIAPSGLKYPN